MTSPTSTRSFVVGRHFASHVHCPKHPPHIQHQQEEDPHNDQAHRLWTCDDALIVPSHGSLCSMHGYCRHQGLLQSLWIVMFVLDVNRTRGKIAQACTHTQRYMNSAWCEMVSCFPCFVCYSFSTFQWFIQTLWDNSYPSSDWCCGLILIPLHSGTFSYDLNLNYTMYSIPYDHVLVDLV